MTTESAVTIDDLNDIIAQLEAFKNVGQRKLDAAEAKMDSLNKQIEYAYARGFLFATQAAIQVVREAEKAHSAQGIGEKR